MMVQGSRCRLLAWLWVLILGLPPASYTTLDTWHSLSEPWFAPLQNGGDDIPCIIGLCWGRNQKTRQGRLRVTQVT